MDEARSAAVTEAFVKLYAPSVAPNIVWYTV